MQSYLDFEKPIAELETRVAEPIVMNPGDGVHLCGRIELVHVDGRPSGDLLHPQPHPPRLEWRRFGVDDVESLLGPHGSTHGDNVRRVRSSEPRYTSRPRSTS